MGSRAGALKAAAKKTGDDPCDYFRRIEQRLKWCTRGRHWCQREQFGRDLSRYDGLAAACTECRRVKVRKPAFQPSFKGRRHSDEARDLMSKQRLGNKFAVGHIKSSAQLAVSRDRTIKPRGPKNPNWRGGVSPAHELQRRSPEYRDWRQTVFERDSFTCRNCGDDRGGNLEAHHLKPFATHPELRFEVSNGVTLCEPCHIAAHTGAPRIRMDREHHQRAPAI